MKYIIALSMLLFSSATLAGTWVDVNLISKHSRPTYYNTQSKQIEEFNQENFGIGLTQTLTNNLDFTIGGYKNSFSETSFYTGVNLKAKFGNVFSITPGIAGLLVTGYGDAPINSVMAGKDLLFVPMPNITFSDSQFKLTIGYYSSKLVEENGVSVTTVQFGVKLF